LAAHVLKLIIILQLQRFHFFFLVLYLLECLFYIIRTFTHKRADEFIEQKAQNTQEYKKVYCLIKHQFQTEIHKRTILPQLNRDKVSGKNRYKKLRITTVRYYDAGAGITIKL